MSGPGKKLDPFTQRRLTKFISEFRSDGGVLPTLKDLEGAGFDKDVIDSAIKEKVIEKFYVTLTNGSVVKGFKVLVTDPFASKK